MRDNESMLWMSENRPPDERPVRPGRSGSFTTNSVKRLFRLLEVLDGIEGTIVLVLGTALFVALVAVLPAMLAWQLFSSGSPLRGGLFLAVVLGASFGIARDMKRGRLGVISAALFGVWIVSVGFVAVRLWLK